MRTAVIYYSTTGDALYLAKAFSKDGLHDVFRINDGSDILPDDTERLGVITETNAGGLPPEIEKFFDFLSKRDNSALKYIFSVTTMRRKERFNGRIIEKKFEDAGLNLSYYNVIFFPTLERALAETVFPKADVARSLLVMKDEINDKIRAVVRETEEEKILLPKASLTYRLDMKRGEKNNTPSAPRRGLGIGERCTGCALCYHICPMGNIRMEDGKAHMGMNCISCFSCYKLCPRSAVRLDEKIGKITPLVDIKELYKR